MKTEGLARQQVLREMMDLAMGRANDAVKLAYLDQDGLGQIDGLDLRCLTEFKRKEQRGSGGQTHRPGGGAGEAPGAAEGGGGRFGGLPGGHGPAGGPGGCVPSGETAIFGQAEAGPGVVEPGLPPPGPGCHCVRQGSAQGKTLCLGLSFFLWSMSRFRGQQFALCGKTTESVRRNLLASVRRCWAGWGFSGRSSGDGTG